MKFDKNSCTNLQKEIVALLAPLEAKYGVKIRPAGGKFGENNLTMKMEISNVDAVTGVVTDKYADALKLYYPSKVGKEYTISGLGKVKLVGYNSRASKKKFIVAMGAKRYVATGAHLGDVDLKWA